MKEHKETTKTSKIKIPDMYGPPILLENYNSFFLRKFKREFTFCKL